jgi:hypothetical protein
MQRKKIDFSKKIKLSNITTESLLPEVHNKSAPKLNLIKNSNNANTVSFRLRKIDMDRLLSTLETANSKNESHPFNRTDLLRGLILLGTEIDPQKILNYIRQSL